MRHYRVYFFSDGGKTYADLPIYTPLGEKQSHDLGGIPLYLRHHVCYRPCVIFKSSMSTASIFKV